MQSDLGFKNDGTITMLTVQPGDRVKQGQVPAQQDPTNLKLALDQAENTVLQDQISLESAIINRDSKEKILKQQERLFQAGVSSEMELDTARNNYRKSELELKTAQVRLENDQAKVELARSYLNDATLVAPFDGIVGTVNGQVGQINGINASSSILLTVMSEDLQLNALVNEADIGRVRIGQEVEFTSNTYPDEVFQGKVLRITPEAQTVSSVQYYPVLTDDVEYIPLEITDLETEITRRLDSSPALWKAEQEVNLAELSLQLHTYTNIYNYNSTRLNINKAELSAEQAKEQARQNMRTMYDQICSLQEQYNQQHQAILLAEDDLESARLKYEMRLIPKGELLSIEADLYSKRQGLKSLIYQHHILKLNFEKPWA